MAARGRVSTRCGRCCYHHEGLDRTAKRSLTAKAHGASLMLAPVSLGLCREPASGGGRSGAARIFLAEVFTSSSCLNAN
jgi:hypothetical protein